jgi:hypothetical protein
VTVTVDSINVNEIAQKLESFGLEVLVDGHELLIPSYVVHVSTAYGDLQLRQGKYEITYINSTKRLCIYNESNECLEIYLPKGSLVRFYHGYLIIELL